MKQIIAVVILAMLFTSCKKEAGEGGLASIRGKVNKDIRLVLTNPGTYLHTVPAADENVFIIYGDHISPDENVDTNFDGEFEFRNLRPGRYTIYVYSSDTTGVVATDPDHMVIMQEVEINDRKEVKELPVMTIYETN